MPPYQESLVRIIGSYCDQNMKGAEIGVSAGATSAVLLRSFPKLLLYMVDSWAETDDNQVKITGQQQYERMRNAERVTAFAAGRRVMVRMASVDAAQVLPDALDWVWIDADHHYEHVLADSVAWWPKIKSGGLLLWHDYAKSEFSVTPAVDEFVATNQLKLNVESGHIAWVQKT